MIKVEENDATEFYYRLLLQGVSCRLAVTSKLTWSKKEEEFIWLSVLGMEHGCSYYTESLSFSCLTTVCPTKSTVLIKTLILTNSLL